MGTVRLLAIAGLFAVLAFAACGDDDDDGGATTQAEAPASADETTTDEPASGSEKESKTNDSGGGGGGQPKSGVEITTASSQFGQALFDSDRRAIYYFDKEQAEASECYGGCAVAWPPVVTEGTPQAGGAVDAKLLGTTERDDGAVQVTYAGRPLYYYVDDPPGQILCHNIVEFGGTWLAVQPNGDPVA